MSSNSILIVGSIAIDTIMTPVEKKENLLGGSITYALIASGGDSKVHVVGIIGKDFPQEGMEIYKTFASDLSGLEVGDGSTFRWGGKYSAGLDERETLYTDLGVFADFNPVLSESNKSHPYVFLANIHPAIQLSIINQCREGATIVVDTMNLWIDTTLDDLLSVLKLSHILLINETEAQQLSGEANLGKAAKKLHTLGPEVIVIKQGSKGATLYKKEEKVSIGIYPIKSIVDSTGAGDTFGGGFVSALANDGDYRQALVQGSAMASFCVEGFGIQALISALPDEIQKRKDFLKTTLTA